jgi:Zn-dependent peptidase ImmA (M78 family)
VARRLGIPRSGVSEIETGRRELSATELFELARLFGQPMEHLLGMAEHEPEEELVMLRAEEVTPATRAELGRFLQLCHEYRQLEQWAGEHSEPELRSVPAVLSTYEQARALASEERKRLDLGVTPAHHLVSVLEDRVGVKVLFLELDDALSGTSILSESFGPAILVNRSHPAGRRAFTLAHEYFHLLTRGRVAGARGAQAVHLCETQAPEGKKDRAEQLADQFAGELLMPREHFVEQIRRLLRDDRTVDSVDLIGIAPYFGVSVQAVFVRMAALRMISWEKAKESYEHPETRAEIANSADGDGGPEPIRFKRLAVKAYLAGQISRSRLAELLDVNVVEVDQEVRNFGGEEGGRGIKVSVPR